MEAWIPVVLSVIGSGGILMFILNGIGKWFTRRQEAADARELAHETEKRQLRQQLFEFQQERIKYEQTRRESTDQTMALLLQLSKTVDALSSKGPKQ